MNNFNLMVRAYIECIYFTDTGDTDQPEPDAPLHPQSIRKVAKDVKRFIEVAREQGGNWLVNALTDNAEQAGRDFWFTRNGHGVGFWDTGRGWTEEQGDLLTQCAEMFGESYTYAHEGYVYVEGGR